MSELERLFYTARGTYRRLKVALLAARQRAQRAEARAAAHFAEARQVYERLDARAAIHEQCDRDKQAEIDRLRDELDELARTAEMMRSMNQRHADDLITTIRAQLRAEAELAELRFRFGKMRERAQRAEDELAERVRDVKQAEAERDALCTAHDAMVANFDAACEELRAKSWPRAIARNLYTGAQLCRSFLLGYFAACADDERKADHPFPVKVTRDVLSDGDLQAIADCSPDPDSFIVRVGHAVAVRLKRRSESKA